MAFTDRGRNRLLSQTALGPLLLGPLLFGCSSVPVGGPGDAGDSGMSGTTKVGDPCNADGECGSQVCHGRCCATPCDADPAHPECTACDPTGTCVYPPVQCVEARCDPNTLTATQASICSQGVCPPPASQTCAASCQGTTCGDGCRGDQDCPVNTHCVVAADGGEATLAEPVGTCVAQASGGAACVTSDDCQSGICLSGVCCNSACSQLDPAHPECTACDSTGACIYPAAACSPAQCDSVANAFSPGSTCAAGACPAVTPQSCGTYQCSPTGCGQSCLADLDCAVSGFCVQDGDAGSCCPILVEGATLYVDNFRGSDRSCCGITADAPCATIARAFGVADFSASKGQALGLAALDRYTLVLTVDGGGGDWQTPPAGAPADSFPLVVPRGITIHAPGVLLGGLILRDSDLFARAFVDAGFTDLPGGYFAALEGETGRPAVVGINGRNQLTGNLTITAGGTVNLSNVLLYNGLTTQNSFTGPSSNFYIYSSPLQVNLGLDSHGDAGGLVQIGWAPDAGPLNGSLLIPVPNGGAIIRGATTVSDFGPPGVSVFQVFGPGFLLDYANTAILTHNPLFLAGSNIQTAGLLRLSNATILNAQGPGLTVAHGQAHVDHSTIEYSGCEGARVGIGRNDPGLYSEPDPASPANYDQGGSLYLSHSTVAYNAVGVHLDGPEYDEGYEPYVATWEGQLLDLRYDSDGGPGGDRIFCNAPKYVQSVDAGACDWFANNDNDAGVGANVWNSSAHPLLANNVAWGPTLPTVWTCDEALDPTSCTQGGHPLCTGGELLLLDGGLLDAGPVSCQSLVPPVVETPDSNSNALGTTYLEYPTLAVTSCP